MTRSHKMRLRRNRAESLGCHDRHPLPRVCLREPGSRDVINWQWRYVIRAQIICYRNNRYSHDVLECLLVKNCPTPPGLPIPVANKIQKQYNTKTGPQTDDVWRILWRQREREAVATDFLRRPFATPEWRWFWHANKIYGITPFMLNGLYRNMPVFLEDSFLILEHKVSFGFVPFPSSALIYKNVPRGKPAFNARLSCQWSVALQRDSRPAIWNPCSLQTVSQPTYWLHHHAFNKIKVWITLSMGWR